MCIFNTYAYTRYMLVPDLQNKYSFISHLICIQFVRFPWTIQAQFVTQFVKWVLGRYDAFVFFGMLQKIIASEGFLVNRQRQCTIHFA